MLAVLISTGLLIRYRECTLFPLCADRTYRLTLREHEG